MYKHVTRLSNRHLISLYVCVRSAAVAAAPSAVCCYCCRFFLFRRHDVRFHLTLLQNVRVCYSYVPACCCCVRTVFSYTAAAACCCCSSSCAGWQKLLLWFTESDSNFFLSLHSNTICFQCAPWWYCRIYSVIVYLEYITYHTSSVLRGFGEPRLALARRGGASLVCTYRCVCHVVPAIEKSDLDQVLSHRRPSPR